MIRFMIAEGTKLAVWLVKASVILYIVGLVVNGGSINKNGSGIVSRMLNATSGSSESNTEPTGSPQNIDYKMPESPYAEQIYAAAIKNNVDPILFDSLVFRESSYDASAVSTAGAVSLSQIMPIAHEDRCTDYTWSQIVNDVEANLDCGARHLRNNLDTFDGNVFDALQSYNQGITSYRTYGAVNSYANDIIARTESVKAEQGFVAQSQAQVQQVSSATGTGKVGNLYGDVPFGTLVGTMHGTPGYENFYGVDIGNGYDSPLYAPIDGTVSGGYEAWIGAYDDKGTGNSYLQIDGTGEYAGITILIYHGDYVMTSGTVKRGDYLGTEQAIGNTTQIGVPNSEFPHTHITMRVNGSVVNYLNYIE